MTPANAVAVPSHIILWPRNPSLPLPEPEDCFAARVRRLAATRTRAPLICGDATGPDAKPRDVSRGLVTLEDHLKHAERGGWAYGRMDSATRAALLAPPAGEAR